MEVFKERLDGALSAWVTRWDRSQVGLDDLGDLFQPKQSWHVVILSMTVAKPWNSCCGVSHSGHIPNPPGRIPVPLAPGLDHLQRSLPTLTNCDSLKPTIHIHEGIMVPSCSRS